MHGITVHGIALDIDNTLSDTNQFWATKLHNIVGHPELSPAELVEKYRSPDRVPEWQGTDALAWMHEARNSSELQKEIPLIENVHHMVNQLQAIIPIAAYVTGRPEIVRAGTQEWLTMHDFPPAPLIMRPPTIDHDGWQDWKGEMVGSLYPLVQSIVDDDATFVGRVPAGYPGTIFLYGQDTCPREDIRVICSKTWEDVLTAVRSVYQSSTH